MTIGRVNGRTYIIWGAAFAALAVLLGAFGAHGLKNLVGPERVAIYETGITYHFYHSFALILLGLSIEHFGINALLKWSARCFMVGLLFFSGSLYLLAIREVLTLLPVMILGPMTPIGGVFFVLGWVLMAVGLSRSRKG